VIIYAYYTIDPRTRQERYVTLQEHAVNTYRIGNCLFDQSIEFLGKTLAILKINIDIKKVFNYALLLHDMGKALLYYQDRVRDVKKGVREELGFQYHEYIGAIILVATSYYESIFEYEYAAKAIARHHAAMTCRSPYELIQDHRCKEKHEKLKNILKNIVDSKETIEMFLERLCESGLIDKSVVEDLSETLDKAGEVVNAFPSYLKKLAFLDKNRGDHRLIYTLTGYLVISDILAASLLENRSDSSGLSRGYVKYWICELESKLVDCGVRVSENTCL